MRRAFLAAPLLLIAGCSLLPIGPRDVPGTYVMNRGHAADTLFVLPGGRYRHVYAMPGQPVVIESGAWTADRSRRTTVITFESLWPRWRTETETSSLSRSPLAPANLRAEAMRTFSGRIKWWVDEDLDWAYVRR
jgi:hypothetical protein